MKLIMLTVLLMLISGCSRKDSDLDNYIALIKSQPPAKVAPLPDMTIASTAIYKASEMRSPFLRASRQLAALEDAVHPEDNRKKQPLEYFPLDSLKMVGTIEKKQKIWALLLDSEGLIYRAGIGDYLGQNHGKITVISEAALELKEIVPDPAAGWRERHSKIMLEGQ